MPAAGKKRGLQYAIEGQRERSTERGAILVVDDEPEILAFAKLVIERSGYEVLSANDGAQAVETMRAHAGEISLVLLDLNMPGMSAEAAFGALREIRPVPVLLTSGSMGPEEPAASAFAGACGFLQKPYTLQQLTDAVEDAARRSGDGNGNAA